MQLGRRTSLVGLLLLGSLLWAFLGAMSCRAAETDGSRGKGTIGITCRNVEGEITLFRAVSPEVAERLKDLKGGCGIEELTIEQIQQLSDDAR